MFFHLRHKVSKLLITLIFGTLISGHSHATSNETVGATTKGNTIVVMETTLGSVEVELFDKKAPITVANFLAYVDENYYADTLFHRVIPGFMIQGGGFEAGMVQKQTKAPIKNEAQSFIPNKRGSIAMARTNAPNSATSQFFINVENNHFLNKSASQAGYAVFGQVISGMDTVDKIVKSQTSRRGPYSDVPVEDIKILSIKRR